ncbi:MAG: site-specific integrase [Phycisphaeraceae bacterium]
MSRHAITLVKRNAGGIAYWDARWYDPTAGKRRGRSIGRCDKLSKRQAQKLLSRIEVEFEHDPRARSPETIPTLGEWLELLIQRKRAAGRKPKTMRDYDITKRLLIRHFGSDRRLNTITKFDLEQFRVRLAQHKLHDALNNKNHRRANAVSVVKYMRLVAAIFNEAFDDDLMPRNPTKKLGLPQSPASTWRKIDADEFWKLYNAAHESLKPLLALCRLAALRYSDALGLRWSNVRFDEGVLTFRPMKVERFAKVDARVPICAELRTILEELRHPTLPGLPGAAIRIDGYVVPRDAPKQGYEQFKQACKRAGLEPWSKPFHTLRKSCIDDWARLAPPNVVMEWATHTTLSTTMKYYAKVHRADESLGQMQLLRPQTQQPILPWVAAAQ